MKRLGQKICVAVVLSLALVAIWHDSAQAAMPDISPLGQIKDELIGNPGRIDVDAAGTIYLCVGNVGVTRYDKYGQALPTLHGDYAVRSGGVAVTPDGSRVFVTVAGPDNPLPTAVAVIDGSTGALLGYLGAGFDEFQRAGEIDLDGAGNIYVADRNALKINVYNGSSYVKLNSFGGPATNLVGAYYLPRPGEFGEIGGLTVDVASEEILVAEGWNNNGIARVQVFGIDGTFKRLLAEATIAGTQINCKPIGLTVDPAGRVYMLSIFTNTIHVFTTEAPPATDLYLGKYTKGTPDPAYWSDANGNQIPYPWTVGMITTPAFDSVFDPATGRLFVVTDGNGIQIFSVDGSTNPLKINTAPETPAIVSPVQGSQVATLTPTLQWLAASDAEGDVLTYKVQIIAADGTTVSSTVNGPSLSVADNLLENNRYSWQVQAADAELTSAYSAVENFWVNAIEEAPTVPVLAGPNAAATVDKETVFSWQAATDADPFATLTYRLEIAKDGDFANPVISVASAALNSAALSTLPGYASLQSGGAYQWRVVAVDNTGRETSSEVRSITYLSTILTVDATFPGAKVYLGGNSAYSGRFVGEVPVTLRDINPGTIEVVVERPGFEPWLKSVVVAAGQDIVVNAALVVAILPAEFKLSGGFKLQGQGGTVTAPLYVDFDSDGLVDLLVADGSGKLLLYKGAAGIPWPLVVPVQLGVTLPGGAIPFAADWNNDDRKDLLVGAAVGTVSLYLNSGTQAAPLFADGALLLSAGDAQLNIGANAAPVVFDVNNDGAKDLLVGSGDGSVWKFLNIGSDASPVLAAGEVLIPAAPGAANASLVVADWNADGIKEILLAANQEITVYSRQGDGYVQGAPLTLQQSLSSTTTRVTTMSTANFGEKVRIVAANIDGIRGKDLLIGNAAGELLLAESTMNKVSAISPLFDVALLATVTEIQALMVKNNRSTPVLTSMLSQLKTNISSSAANKLNFYFKAKKDLLYMQNTLQADAGISALLARLQVQLNSQIPLN